MELKKNFYQKPQIAGAFFVLQEKVFPGLDLAFAWDTCHLDKASIPYGLFAGETAVSILNATPQTILFDDQQYQAVQIGTVATHPDWRGQGLSGKLLKQMLADYREQADFFFLFANREVLNFYPRFGFTAVTEHRFERSFTLGSNSLRQLHLTNPVDQEFFRQHMVGTTAVSNQFGIADYDVLRDFVLNKFMPDAVWWDETEEILLVVGVQEGRLTIFDLIGKHLPGNYIENLQWPGIQTLETWFTPELFVGNFQSTPHKDDNDQLFVRINGENPGLMKALSKPFRVPALAKT